MRTWREQREAQAYEQQQRLLARLSLGWFIFALVILPAIIGGD